MIDQQLEFHPVADIFPMMNASEYSGLISDVQENGLLEPIWLHSDGRIIDGRNRYRACLEGGVEPTFKTYEGPESMLVPFVVSLNLHRRHLDSGQLAFVALAIESYEGERAKEEQRKAGGDRKSQEYKTLREIESIPRQMTSGQLAYAALAIEEHEAEKAVERQSVPQMFAEPMLRNEREARTKAAEAVGTNRQYVSDAKAIRKKAPELEKEVMNGSLSLPQAKQAARLDEETRKVVVEKVKAGEAKNIKQAQRQLKDEKRIELVKEAESRPESDEFKVIVGDCLEEVKNLESGSIKCFITDPPYGIETHRTREGGKDYADGEDYALELLDKLCELVKPKLAEDAHGYVFSGYTHANAFKEILKKHFEVQDNPIIWVKTNHTMCDFSQWYPSKHEYIWFFKKGKGRDLSKCVPDVVGPYAPGKETTHSAEKPVELLDLFVSQSTDPFDTVLDPFVGSGSTAVSAVRLKRKFIGFELDEKWANIAKGRLNEL